VGQGVLFYGEQTLTIIEFSGFSAMCGVTGKYAKIVECAAVLSNVRCASQIANVSHHNMTASVTLLAYGATHHMRVRTAAPAWTPGCGGAKGAPATARRLASESCLWAIAGVADYIYVTGDYCCNIRKGTALSLTIYALAWRTAV
jgi:hypothetical protein